MGVPARDAVAGFGFGQRRAFPGALVRSVAAAGAERTARGHVQRAGHVALQDDAATLQLGIDWV